MKPIRHEMISVCLQIPSYPQFPWSFPHFTTKWPVSNQAHNLAFKCTFVPKPDWTLLHSQRSLLAWAWTWERLHLSGWPPKNCCFWIVVLEETLESPLDCKEIKFINSEGNQPWVLIGRTDPEAEAPILWPSHEKRRFPGKDPWDIWCYLVHAYYTNTLAGWLGEQRLNLPCAQN